MINFIDTVTIGILIAIVAFGCGVATGGSFSDERAVKMITNTGGFYVTTHNFICQEKNARTPNNEQ